MRGQLHHVLCRHEQGALHMAEGYAKATGKVGVALTARCAEDDGGPVCGA
jgi:thiamine pyrophosphate-dependent acetolactate synthase large subunit-like protein